MDTEKLIALVYNRSALWDQKNRGYHSRDVVKNLWLEVAAELHESYHDVRAKWRGLRDTFRRELQKCRYMPLDGDRRLLRSRWTYFNSLMFLKSSIQSKHFDNRPVNAHGKDDEEVPLNFDETSGEETNQEINVEEDFPKFEHMQNPEICSESIVFEPLQPRKSKRSNATEELLNLEREKLRLYRSNCLRNNDSDYHFLLSLVSEFRRIPAHRKLQVRMKIEQILLEEQQNHPTSPLPSDNPRSNDESTNNQEDAITEYLDHPLFAD